MKPYIAALTTFQTVSVSLWAPKTTISTNIAAPR